MLELGDQHAGGLADLGARQRVELGPGVAVGVSGGRLEVVIEQVEQRDACQLGGDDGAGELFVVEGPGRLRNKSSAPTYSPATTTGIA